MNIKCSFCQMPFTLSRVEMLDALQEMEAGKLNHHDAHCPRCRRANPIQRQRMEMFFPNWRDELKKFEADWREHAQQAVPLSTTESTPVKQTESTPEPVPAKAKIKGDTKAKPPTKRNIGQMPAARAELGNKAPAKNTPATSRSRGKKKSK